MYIYKHISSFCLDLSILQIWLYNRGYISLFYVCNYIDTIYIYVIIYIVILCIYTPLPMILYTQFKCIPLGIPSIYIYPFNIRIMVNLLPRSMIYFIPYPKYRSSTRIDSLPGLPPADELQLHHASEAWNQGVKMCGESPSLLGSVADYLIIYICVYLNSLHCITFVYIYTKMILLY